jgi:hypothetical protein
MRKRTEQDEGADNYFDTCTVQLLLVCFVANNSTIISQITTFLRISTLLCYLWDLAINTLPSYTSISIAALGNTIYN